MYRRRRRRRWALGRIGPAPHQSRAACTEGRGSARFAVIVEFGWRQFRTIPAFLHRLDVDLAGALVDCTITCAKPLKSERFGSLSLSWQLGSPLPTPISAAVAGDLESDPVVRRGHRPAFLVERFHLQDCDVFAVGIDLGPVAVSRMATVGPVVSRFSVSTPCRPSSHAPRSTPGSYFTFHSTWPRCGTFWLPWLLPLTNNSTSSRFE
jgi:hypothetical protein